MAFFTQIFDLFPKTTQSIKCRGDNQHPFVFENLVFKHLEDVSQNADPATM